MSKKDSSSPTVSLIAVLITCVIEAHENRETAMVDIPNAFVQTDNKGETVIMKITGQLARFLVKTCPELYAKYVHYIKGIPTIYVELLKALYGMMRSSLLFYKKLVKDLTDIGFEVNPYDPCIANMMVDGKQLTVTWHVDDLKISHQDKAVVDEFIQWICNKYEDVTPVKPSRGKVHDYLGMTLDYSEAGKVKIHMKNYIEKMIEEFPYKNEVKGKTAFTPAADYLFKINDDLPKLTKVKAEIFHTYVPKALFLCKRSRADIQTATTFLYTRVKEPDEHD